MSTVSQCVQCLSRIKISEATRWLFTRPSPIQLVAAGYLTSRTQQYRSGDAEKNPGATERREMSDDGASLHEPCEGRFISDDARTTSLVGGDASANRPSRTAENLERWRHTTEAPRWAPATCDAGKQQRIVIQPQVPYHHSSSRRVPSQMRRKRTSKDAETPPTPQIQGRKHFNS